MEFVKEPYLQISIKDSFFSQTVFGICNQ